MGEKSQVLLGGQSRNSGSTFDESPLSMRSVSPSPRQTATNFNRDDNMLSAG